MERRQVHYSGRVQGVGFRYETQRIAQASPIVGYVQNLDDGRVKIVAEGAPTDIDAFLADVADRMSGLIRDIQVEAPSATGEFSKFQVRQ